MTKIESNISMRRIPGGLRLSARSFAARSFAVMTVAWAMAQLSACEPECTSDTDCPGGEVCELSTGCQSPAQCVPGCREDSQCDPGEFCNQVQCITCPCPGSCEPRDESCETDANCPFGEVCELGVGCQEPLKCTPGCRDDAQCPEGLACQQVVCITCPCPGLCAGSE